MIKNSIVLVPFPFDNFSDLKVRPALCLTSEIGIYNHIVIAFISSKISSNLLESEILINKNSDNWIGTGLSVDSIIKLHKIVTIPKVMIRRRLGFINNEILTEVNRKLSVLFEI